MTKFKDLLRKKRDGNALTKLEIAALVSMFTDPMVTKSQIAALLMAIYLKGMNKSEISALTLAMAESGEVLDLSFLKEPSADKHSTGGVGDKTSLVLVPLLAAAGLKMAKLSGKALGHTGGTLDKLSCFSGLRMDLTTQEMRDLLEEVGCFISGQTAEMVPADKLMYALRNETATVDSIPLIASSIMSKKIASGAGHILLDVKVGQGAIFSNAEKCHELARCMVDIGNALGRPTKAILTNMNQPLGFAIGNQLEVTEALDTLRGKGALKLRELCLVLGQHLLQLSGLCLDSEDARSRLEYQLDSGGALQKFKDMIAAQGGDTTQIDSPDAAPSAKNKRTMTSGMSGFVSSIKTRELGILAMAAMDQNHQKSIDLLAGILLHKEVGDQIEPGEPILTVFAESDQQIEALKDDLKSCVEISNVPPNQQSLILNVIE